MLKHLFSFVIIFCIARGAVAQKQGIPLLTNFESGNYKASSQNWGITQLPSGEMLFANDFGLLVYDGRQWKLFEEEITFSSRSIAAKNNRILIGCEHQIYSLEVDSVGKMAFQSILPKLPDSLSKFGNVEGMLSFENKLAFFSENYLFLVEGEKVQHVFSESKIKTVFEIKGQLYASVEDRGLLRFENGTLVSIVGYKNFIENRAVSMVPIKNGILVLTEKKGFFFIEIDPYGYERKVTKMGSNLDSLFSTIDITGYYPLNKSLVGISTENHGFFVLQNLDKIVSHIDIEKGLQAELVNDALLDDYGSLWLALNNGISKVDISYPIEVFDSRNGLEGLVESMTMHENKVFAATHSGVYSLSPSSNKFKEIIPIQAWDVLSFETEKESKLLVATNNDISEFTSNGELQTIFECYPWKMFQLKDPSNTVLVGTDPGITAIKWENNNWVIGQDNGKVESEIGNFTQFKKEVWMGTRGSVPYYISQLEWVADSADYKNLKEYGWDKGLFEGEINIFMWQDKVMFGTSQGVYSFENDSFKITNLFKGLDSLSLLHRAFNWKNKELWAVTLHKNKFQFGFVNDTNLWNYRLFNPIAKDIVHSIIADQDDNILLGGAGGVFKYNRNHSFDIETPFNCKLSKVYLMEDSVIHNGFWQDSIGTFTVVQPKSKIPSFHYKTNSISFEYASMTFGDEDDIKFSYWLVGNDKRWSKWTEEHKKEYTNLKPGDYVFKIKAINVLETESRVSEYRFRVNKPWFQSPWYYAGQTAVLAILVFLTVFLNQSEKPSAFSSVIAFVTIITVFEFLIMVIEPYFIKYTGEIPVFNLIMNILMAMSLAPVERIIKRYLNKKNHV